MTSIFDDNDARLHTLRQMLRGLYTFRSYYHSDNIDHFIAPDGSAWSLHDIERLYADAMRPPCPVGPFKATMEQIKPDWLVKHSGQWARVATVEAHPVRSDLIILTLDDGRSKRRARDVEVICLTREHIRVMEHHKGLPHLPLRQRQAIEFYLVRNIPEEDVATAMGIDSDSPIRMYATTGLKTLLDFMDRGVIPSPFDTPESTLAQAS